MWIAHFAPALILTRFSPSTPIWALGFAGILPDFLFFLNAMLGIESIVYSDKSKDSTYVNLTGGKGSQCFPYDCDYPYTHSLPGIAVIGVIFASIITLTRRLPLYSFVVLVTATLSHFPLDFAVHRHDIAVKTSEPIYKRHGVPLLDYPTGVFVSDLGIFVFALLFHARTANPAGDSVDGKRPGGRTTSTEPRRDASKAYLAAMAVATLVMIDFSYFGAPTENARWVHGPIFMGQILGLSYGLQKLEEFTDSGGKYQVTNVKEALKKKQ